MQLIVFVGLSFLLAAVAHSAVNAPQGASGLNRFRRRHLIDLTPYSSSRVAEHLQMRGRWWWVGVAVGIAWCLSGIFEDRLRIQAFPIVAGGLAGLLLAELRPRSPRRAALGLLLAPPFLVLIWRCVAILAGALALSTVLRSTWLEVPIAARAWAVLALALTLAVHVLVRDLHTRPLPRGPADLVGAELAIRSRSARSLLAAGGSVALWSAFNTGLPSLPGAPVAAFLITYGLPLLAWIAAAQPWSPSAPMRERGRIWVPATATVLTGAALTAVWLIPVQEPSETHLTLSRGMTAPVLYAWVDENPARWQLADHPDQSFSFEQAAITLGVRPAPFAISGDGHRLVYMDKDTRRLVQLDLANAAYHDLTEPLANGAAPEVAMSPDGRYVTLAGATGVELVDTGTGGRTRLPGIARVLGVGQDTVVATTGRRAVRPAPDTELLVLDHRGGVRNRIPFDPTLDVRLAPDLSALVILDEDEVVTMDPTTGRVRERHELHLPERSAEMSMLSWDGGHRLLIRIEPVDSDKTRGYLLDPSTGKAKPYEAMPEDGPVVGGSVS